MQQQDWLLRQIEAIGQFLAALRGQVDSEAAVEAELQARTGMSLEMLEGLPPHVAVRLLTNRMGDRPEQAFAVFKLVEEASDHREALTPHANALEDAVVTAIGREGFDALERQVQAHQDEAE